MPGDKKGRVQTYKVECKLSFGEEANFIFARSQINRLSWVGRIMK